MLKGLVRRLTRWLIAADPAPDGLTGADIRDRYGDEALRAWHRAGTPEVTPDDFGVGGRFHACRDVDER